MDRKLTALLAAALLLAACGAPPARSASPPALPTAALRLPATPAPSPTPAPAPPPPAGRPDPARLRNAELPAAAARGGRASLRDGIYREQIPGPEGVRELVVALSDLLAFADLDGDGVEEAAALLVTLPPGEPPAFELVALAGAERPQPLAVLRLGGGLVIEGLGAESGQLILDTIRPAAGDDPCCPSLRVRQRLALREGRLVVVEQTALQSRPRLADPGAAAPHRIELPGDAGAASVNGMAGPGVIDAYLLRGAAGQRAVITVDSPGGAFFGLLTAGGGPPVVPLESGAQAWEGELPATGDYTLYVGAGANTPYTLSVSLPEPPPPPAPVAPAPAPIGGQVIYLTFDDGPHPTYTPLVLDALARYGARATFFVIGQQAAAYPELIRRMHAEGHRVANHSYSHAALGGFGRELFMAEVGRTEEILGAEGAPCMRPPYGSRDGSTEGYAAELGLQVVMWTVDPADWARPGAGYIAEQVLARAAPGAIVLLHDGGGDRAQTVAALETILAGLSAQGYSFAPVC